MVEGSVNGTVPARAAALSPRALYLSDRPQEVLPWLESIAADQRRRHPGRVVTLAGVAREALLLARASPELNERLRR